MDVAWCLTCSKRTANPCQSYCSEACRLQDIPETQSTPQRRVSVSFTASIPRHLILTPTAVKTADPVPNDEKVVRRPVMDALPPSASIDLIGHKAGSRDRRAFSFPAARTTAPVLTKERQGRQSSNVLPPFTRKPASVVLYSISSPFLPPMRQSLLRLGANEPSKLIGADASMDNDAVFWSTSESSNNEAPESVRLRAHRPSFLAKQGDSSKLKLSVRHSSHLSIRMTSQGPEAALVASSASSRSREDIMSWARAVEGRLAQDDTFFSEEDKPHRGRSQARRAQVFSLIEPSIEELIDDNSRAAAGTTPKGRTGSAFAGLDLFSFGVEPTVKAFTSVTVNCPQETQPTGLGLQSVPSAPTAEVSRVAVVTSTITVAPETPATFFNPGATPTLSTISFSEAMEPSVITDNPEQVDVVTDDQQSSSSYYALRQVSGITKNRVAQPPSKQPAGLFSPIATMATAIWNIGTYIGSFTPRAIPAIVKPYVPIAANRRPTAVKQDTSKASDFAQPVSPMPTGKTDVLGQSPVQVLRSFPLGTVVPASGIGKNRERLRERELREMRDRSRLRSASRSCRRQVSPSLSSSRGIVHTRKWSYDADTSDNDLEGSRRGRSRRGKALNRGVPSRASDLAVSVNIRTVPGEDCSRVERRTLWAS